MTKDSIVEIAIRDHIQIAAELNEHTGAVPAEYLDQDAADMREKLNFLLGDRPITDDMLVGVVIGAVIMQGAVEGCAEEGGAEYAVAIAGPMATLTIVKAARLREGLACAGFDFESAFGGAA